MKKLKQIAIATGCLILIAVSWHVALGSKTTAQKQLDLIQKADEYMADGVFILAAPLLEEAAALGSKYTAQAEEKLKAAYLSLLDNTGYPRRYAALLDKQMSRPDAAAEIFAEAASYYMGANALPEALAVLCDGIERTGDASLARLYESVRYAYTVSRTAFDDVLPIYGKTMQARQNGKWGIADTSGALVIPCIYDKISAFSDDRAIVKKDGLIYAVDKKNNRIALAPDGTLDFRNIDGDRTSLLMPDGWRRAGSDLKPGKNTFEDIGMYGEGYAAAKTEGKWGVIGTGNDWLIAPQYDGIFCDELGRCYGQGAVFVQSGGAALLHSNGKLTDNSYQAARPFTSAGYAAVRQNGKWGFIDAHGNVAIDFLYDDALSFSGHLAAVKLNGKWGYISLCGELVIDAQFIEAKSFSGGSAPVLTERGWQIITLIEYKRGAKLL